MMRFSHPKLLRSLGTSALLAVSVDAASAADSGRWTLVAESLADQESAQLESRGFVEMGLPSEVRPAHGSDGQAVYRVVIGNFATKQEAAAYAEPLKTSQGLVQLWIAPY